MKQQLFKLESEKNHRFKLALANVDLSMQDFLDSCVTLLCQYSEGSLPQPYKSTMETIICANAYAAKSHEK